MGFAVVPLLAGRVFLYWDNLQQHFVQTAFLREGLKAGRIPQWWPGIGAGFPVVAEGQAAHFNPIRLAFAYLFPTPAAFMLEIGFYLGIAGVSMYFFLREFRLRRDACLVGAICQMFGSYSVVFIRNMALHRSFAFIPLGMLAAERFARRPSLLSGLGISAITGLQLTSGHPTFAIVTAVSTTLYVGLRQLERMHDSGESVRRAVRVLSRSLVLWCGAIISGTALGAIQFVPTLRHIPHSIRDGGLRFEYAVNGVVTGVRHLAAGLFPYMYGQGDWIPGIMDGAYFNGAPNAEIYIGVLPLLLALFAFGHRPARNRPAWPLAILGLIAVGFAMGGQTPFFPALWSLPGMGGLRYPTRFLLVVGLCGSGLASIGYHNLLVRGRRGRLRVVDGLPLLGFGVTGGLAAVVFLQRKEWLAGIIRIASDFETGILISVGLMALSLGLVSAILLTRARSRALRFMVVAVALLDLVVFRVRSGYAPSVPLDTIAEPPAMVNAMEADGQRFRVLSLISMEAGLNRNEDLFRYLQANVSMLWGVESADAYASLMLKRYYAVEQGLVWELGNSPPSAAKLASFLGALNVRYVVGPRSAVLDGWEIVYEDGKSRMWRNPAFLSRARLVGQVIPEEIEIRDEWFKRSAIDRLSPYYGMIPDWWSRYEDAEIIDNVMAMQIDFANTAVLAADRAPDITGHDPAATVRVLDELPDEEAWEVVSRERELLVISNNYYPGWTATVNGRPEPVHRVNYVGMGVVLPPGRSVVRMRFWTPGLGLGMAVSAGAVVLWLLAFAFGLRAAIRRRGGPTAT